MLQYLIHLERDDLMNTDQKLDLLLEKVERLEPLIEKFDNLDKKVDNLDKKVDNLDKKVDNLDKKVDSLDKKVDSLDVRMEAVEGRLLSVELTLENETNQNIQTIAEGHSILGRKLDEALKITNDKELLAVRVTKLEEEVRKLKAANQ